MSALDTLTGSDLGAALSADEAAAASGSISRAPLPPALDYVALIAEGTALTQQLSGKIWTDYNYSDPGVTILEQLCYALTELSYRADFPVAEQLGAPDTGQIALQRQGLYPVREIMPVNPVTIADLRRVVIDQVGEAGNVWFTRLPTERTGGVWGLYRISVLAPGLDPCCGGGGVDTKALGQRVLDCYCAHRALCEDADDEVSVLQPVLAEVHAGVQLDNEADPDAVMAALLFGLGLKMAPEPRRASLDELKARGLTTAEIFHGPLVRRGFIDDDQLAAPLPRVIAVEDLLEIMAETPGVLAVDQLRVHVQGHAEPYGRNARIDVGEGNVLWLDTQPHDGRYSIRLLHGATVCRPNPARVRRLLDRAWAAQRRTYDLWPEYEEDYRTPAGQGGDLAQYVSVQNQFPAVYGIGAYGLPGEATTPRQAQAKQLKGYLMVFDQLMADFVSQVAFTRDLVSIAAGGDRTYACQSLRGIVPNAEPLLDVGYEAGLQALIAANDPVLTRQNMVLDFLLSVYAERLEAPVNTACGDREAAPGDGLLRAKQALLARMEPATRDRGRGVDYRRSGALRQAAGLEVRCRIQLALLDDDRSHEPRPVGDPREADFGRRLDPVEAAVVEERFLRVEAVEHAVEPEPPGARSPLAGRRVATSLLPALGDPLRYRVGALGETSSGGGRVSLVCKALDDVWWRIDECRDAAQAVALTSAMVRAANGDHRRLYVVEWTLLRYARRHRPHHDDDHGLPEDFSFRISAVMLARQTPEDDHAWRRTARAILRENMPAHILVEDLFLAPHPMRTFLRLYDAWMAALGEGPGRRLAEASWNLAHFLSRHTRSPEPGGEAASPALPPALAPPPAPDADRT